MTRYTVVLGATLGALLATRSANAEENKGEGKYRFGAKGFVISVDRLLPLLSYQSVKLTDDAGNSTTASHTSVSILNTGPFGGVYSTFYNLPRIGFDWIPVQNFTIGGAAWLYGDLQASFKTSGAGSGTTTSTDTAKATYWGLAPRVGYIIPLIDKLYVWPRGGIEYHHVTYSDGSQAVRQFAFEAEAMVVISPWDHFGFMVGPTIDVPLSGEQTDSTSTTTGGTTTTTTTRYDSSMFQVGLSAGILGHF